MDVGRCNGKYFINGMGLGFDAQVALDNYHMENGGGVRKGSKAKYTWHIVKNILFYKERPMRVTLEGRTVEQRSFLNTIANGRRLAGGIHITPKALADDGLLDVCMTDPLSVPMRFKELVSFQHQTHLSRSRGALPPGRPGRRSSSTRKRPPTSTARSPSRSATTSTWCPRACAPSTTPRGRITSGSPRQ